MNEHEIQRLRAAGLSRESAEVIVATSMTAPAELDRLPVLRLTGEQINSIEPPLDMDYWFTDWDEHEEFVRLSDVRLAAARQPEPGCEVALREAYTLGWRDHEAGIASRPPATPPPSPEPLDLPLGHSEQCQGDGRAEGRHYDCRCQCHGYER